MARSRESSRRMILRRNSTARWRGRFSRDIASGTINPADILSRYINDEDQYKEVAALFNASLGDALDSAEQKKAFSDTVLKVKKYSLDAASRNAKDIAQLQEIIKQQAALKTLRIPMD